MEYMTNFRSGYFEIGDSQIYYEMMGEGPALVLNHGFGLDTRMWNAQFAVFANQFTVIRYDERSFGKSKKGNDPYSIHGDTLALLQHLKIEKTYFAGVSFGAYSALEFALSYPDKVVGLVLCSSSLLGFPRSEEIQAANAVFGEAVKAHDFEKATVISTNMWLNDPNQPTDRVASDVRAKYGEIAGHAFTLPFIPVIPQWLEPSPITRLEEIQVPTLVMAGEFDYQDYRDIAELLVEKISGAKHILLQNAAHLPNMEKPELFNQIVLDYLATVPSAAK